MTRTVLPYINFVNKIIFFEFVITSFKTICEAAIVDYYNFRYNYNAPHCFPQKIIQALRLCCSGFYNGRSRKTRNAESKPGNEKRKVEKICASRRNGSTDVTVGTFA